MKRSKHPETKTESLNLVFFLMKYYKIFIRKKKEEEEAFRPAQYLGGADWNKSNTSFHKRPGNGR